MIMATDLKVGDRVSWNSEARRVTGVIKKKVTSATHFKNYTGSCRERRASVSDSQREDGAPGHAQERSAS
jgi:hypothetical protein